jgi:hypothetical protein
MIQPPFSCGGGSAAAFLAFNVILTHLLKTSGTFLPVFAEHSTY